MACDQQAELPVLNDEFDFTDPAIVAALKNAETHVVNTEPQTRSGDEVIALTRAELEAIKRNAFSAGRKMARKDSSRFPFLDLPAELRVIIYTHYFTDRNPLTAGHQASALPNRLSDTQHCCSSTNTWCKTVRPLISTNLILTCKQIYHEARDDFLYKGRRFKASVGRFDVEFKAIRPHLRFWQYMQHLDLEINPAMNMSARYETGNLIVHLVALLRGGQNLRSFRLKYAATERAESIMRFKDLNVNGAVSLTQVFKGWFEPDEKDVVRKKERLERLLFSILGCACELILSILKYMVADVDG
jgi:hypothetical protein